MLGGGGDKPGQAHTTDATCHHGLHQACCGHIHPMGVVCQLLVLGVGENQEDFW